MIDLDLDAIKDAAARMSIVLQHIQAAVSEARAEGAAGLAVIMEKPDGSGRLTAQFEAEEFFADLAKLAAVPAILAEIAKRDAEIERLTVNEKHNFGAAVRLQTEIERLHQFERGDLIPGKVVSDNLAAAGKWIAEEREACAHVCETMITPGTPWTDDGGIRAQALVTAAQNIRERGNK